jgi:ketosteroid isomerase-like protein
VLPPGSEPITGRPGIQAFWQGGMDIGIKAVKLETEEVTHRADAIFEVGRYALEAAGGQLLDRGKYVVTWQRHAEEWKLHRDIWNTSRPA